jgi:hypothetical protein
LAEGFRAFLISRGVKPTTDWRRRSYSNSEFVELSRKFEEDERKHNTL